MTMQELAELIINGEGAEVRMSSRHGEWFTKVKGYEIRLRRLSSVLQQNGFKAQATPTDANVRALKSAMRSALVTRDAQARAEWEAHTLAYPDAS